MSKREIVRMQVCRGDFYFLFLPQKGMSYRIILTPFNSLVENKGHEWIWGDKVEDCKACSAADGCKDKVCVAADGYAQTFPSVCEALKVFGDKKDLVTMYWALGDCKEHFDPHSKWCTVSSLNSGDALN